MAFDKELSLTISGDPTKLKGALDKAGKNVTSFSDKVKGIGRTATIAGGIVTAALTGIVLKTAEVGDKFDKMSLRTGVSVEALSGLAYAAEISGTNIDTVENSLRFLSSGMKDAADGTGKAAGAFEELDISVVDSKGNLKDTVEVMKEAATKLAAMDDKTRQAALAGEIFGTRYGTQLLPMLKTGGEGIEDLMQKAEKLNLTVSTESSKAAADFTDEMARLKLSLGAAGREIGDTLIPALTPLIEKVTEIVGKVVAWAKENPELIASIVKFGAILGVVAAVGGPILLAAGAISTVVGALGAIGTIATGPIGLAIVAIIGLAAAWKTNLWGIRDTVTDIFAKLKDKFNLFVGFIGKIKDRLSEIFGKIGDKIKGILEKIGLIGKTATPEIKIEAPGIPFHQEGISYVPRKAIYGLDVGERVLTKEENIKYNQQKSYSNTFNVTVTVQGDGDESKIKRAVDKALNEFVRQYGRSGFELAY